MSHDTKKPEQKEQPQKSERTPGRKLTREDLAKVQGGVAAIPGCCTQGCCE